MYFGRFPVTNELGALYFCMGILAPQSIMIYSMCSRKRLDFASPF